MNRDQGFLILSVVLICAALAFGAWRGYKRADLQYQQAVAERIESEQRLEEARLSETTRLNDLYTSKNDIQFSSTPTVPGGKGITLRPGDRLIVKYIRDGTVEMELEP